MRITKENKWKWILSLVIVAVIAIGLTLAYLAVNTEEQENKFTFISTDGPNSMSAALSEPSWVEEKAQNLSPNAVVPKDPQITNTSRADLAEWVGLKIEFEFGTGDAFKQEDVDYLLSFIQIDWSSEWKRANEPNAMSPEEIFYYKPDEEPLLKGETTSPIFTKVSINSDAGNAAMNWLDENEGFVIRVNGAAVQGNIDFTDAKDTINGLL